MPDRSAVSAGRGPVHGELADQVVDARCGGHPGLAAQRPAPPGAMVKLYFGGELEFGLRPTVTALEAYLELLEPSGLPWSVAVLGGDVVGCGLARGSAAVMVRGPRGEEGTFTICSFWPVSALAEIGEVSRARALYEELLAYACPLVLLRRGDRPAHRAAPGELPPGFSRLALSNACVHLICADERVAAG